jgi:hypothetical protein
MRRWYHETEATSRRRLGWYAARVTMTPLFAVMVLVAAVFFAPGDLRQRASRSWRELWS